MANNTKGSARVRLSPGQTTNGAKDLDLLELERLLDQPQSSTVVIDSRRRRPLYFDGRFLAARDLTRDQEYFVTLQADLSRVGGWGVVDGLVVQPPQNPTTLG